MLLEFFLGAPARDLHYKVWQITNQSRPHLERAEKQIRKFGQSTFPIHVSPMDKKVGQKITEQRPQKIPSPPPFRAAWLAERESLYRLDS